MKEWFEDFNFRNDSLRIIEQANSIIREYERQGLTLTLRQLYYQFVARGLRENTERSYKNLGDLIRKGRDAGLISWRAIEDSGRNFVQWHTQEDELEIVSGLESKLVVDRWERQDTYVEVWVEKDALASIVRRAASSLYVPYIACRGYMSASEMWRAGHRMRDADRKGKELVVLHLGDHDPEGVDMTRDIDMRLDKYGLSSGVKVRRLGLNMDQVEEYNPPPNYAKASSSRFEWYVDMCGEECWELDALEPTVLDALEPTVLDALIRDAIGEYVDDDRWRECEEQEEDSRFYLSRVADNWDAIKALIDTEEGR